MSKLPNAPLVEVIFELSWMVNTPDEQEKFQFLLGNMYSQMKSDFPVKENLVQIPLPGFELPVSMFANKPMYRFRKKEGEYPLYQLGPGLLSINTVDAVYVWEEFEQTIISILFGLRQSYSFEKETNINIALKYLDFYPFDFRNNPYDFLRDNLHLDVKSNFFDEATPTFYSFATGYQSGLGQFKQIINKGTLCTQTEGFLVESNLTTQIYTSEFANIAKWMNQAHEFLGSAFKKMTEGKMYNSFK